MLKNIAKFEKIVAGKAYQFLLDTDSNLDHAKEALLQFIGMITQIDQTNKANAANQAAQAAPVAPVEQPVSPVEKVQPVSQEPTPQG